MLSLLGKNRVLKENEMNENVKEEIHAEAEAAPSVIEIRPLDKIETTKLKSIEH